MVRWVEQSGVDCWIQGKHDAQESELCEFLAPTLGGFGSNSLGQLAGIGMSLQDDSAASRETSNALLHVDQTV